MKSVVLSLIMLMTPSSARAADNSAAFEEHTFASRGGTKMPYRLLKPENIEAGKKYPLVLALHGWGERGMDNQKQLKHFGSYFLQAGVRRRFPCFVVLPQANGSWVQHPVFDKPIPLTRRPAANLLMAHEILKGVVKKYPVDPDRLYVMGYSNGACGVWELLEREPHAWAAAAPMAGAGDPSHVGAAKNVPIWVFHGENDPTIPLDRAKELVAALRATHAHPMLTIYPKGVHYHALNGLREKNLLPWMFAQRRGKAPVSLAEVTSSRDMQ
jgi:predicted peptidase